MQIICWEKYETVNEKISKSIKLAQKENKTEHDWVGKVIFWELSKRLNFDPTYKWYMHKPESIQENETHKNLRDFEIQTVNSVLSNWLDQVLITRKKKKNLS